jgi:hypothetical protein
MQGERMVTIPDRKAKRMSTVIMRPAYIAYF